MVAEVSRKDLYDQVWAAPMTKVAKQYGLSDRGLAKLCERNGIPVPPRGYWAKKHAGHRLKQETLPSDTSQYPEFIRIFGNEPLPEEIREAVQTARLKQEKQSSPTQDHGEATPGEELHRSVRATARASRKARLLPDGSINAIGAGLCGISVGPDCVERTIRILDMIARALDKQGLSLQPAENSMKVVSGSDELSFSLIEHVQRHKHTPTTEEQEKEKRMQEKRQRDIRLGNWNFSWERAWPEFDYIRTGQLGIQLSNQYVGNARRSWNDGKTQKVETMIGEIAVGIVAYLTGIRLQREKRERRHREYEESQRRWALHKRREEREEKRRVFVNSLAEKITETENLKAFLAKLPAKSGGTDESDRMISWVRERIQGLEQQLEESSINAVLQQNKLFPEGDDLVDP